MAKKEPKYKKLLPLLLAAYDSTFGICIQSTCPGTFVNDFNDAKRLSKLPELSVISFRPSPEVPGEFWLFNTEVIKPLEGKRYGSNGSNNPE